MTEHQIYISYADANEDWVIDFVTALKSSLCEQLGKIDEHFIWAKYMLRGTDSIQAKNEHLNNSTYLIVILSPAYLNTIDTQEIDKFENSGNIIVIEYDKVDRPNKLKKIVGYLFWDTDKKGIIKQFDKNSNQFKQIISTLARDITTSQLLPPLSQEKYPKSDKNKSSYDRHITIHGDVKNSNLNLGDNSEQNNIPKEQK